MLRVQRELRLPVDRHVFRELDRLPPGLLLGGNGGQVEIDGQRVAQFTAHVVDGIEHLPAIVDHADLVRPDRQTGMTQWRETIFALMHRNAQRPGAYFNIPSARVMEIGVEFEI